MTNCLIYAEPGDGINVSAGTVEIGSTTIAGNGGWGVTRSVGTVTLINSIVWGNTNGGLSGCTATYTDHQGAVGGTGNIDRDPRFVDSATNNYRLGNGSPCANRGINADWMMGATDIEGNDRRLGGKTDMGCYESEAGSGTIFIFR